MTSATALALAQQVLEGPSRPAGLLDLVEQGLLHLWIRSSTSSWFMSTDDTTASPCLTDYLVGDASSQAVMSIRHHPASLRGVPAARCGPPIRHKALDVTNRTGRHPSRARTTGRSIEGFVGIQEGSRPRPRRWFYLRYLDPELVVRDRSQALKGSRRRRASTRKSTELTLSNAHRPRRRATVAAFLEHRDRVVDAEYRIVWRVLSHLPPRPSRNVRLPLMMPRWPGCWDWDRTSPGHWAVRPNGPSRSSLAGRLGRSLRPAPGADPPGRTETRGKTEAVPQLPPCGACPAWKA